ncbi:hypothetical protein K3495_g16711 [Podosphaera aphanis]|nr:hypothetical protein K3495_g16711 [Podosphaera aphanis]
MAISWILDPEEVEPHTGKFSAVTAEAYHIFHPNESVFQKLTHKRPQKQRNRTMSEYGWNADEEIPQLQKNMHIFQNTFNAKNTLERIGINN